MKNSTAAAISGLLLAIGSMIIHAAFSVFAICAVIMFSTSCICGAIEGIKRK
jgi:hypothetical protein